MSSSALQEKTQLIQCFTPTMVAGSYDLAVSQTITTTQPVDGKYLPPSGPVAQAALKFNIDAARFVLNPADIYSVYPPAGQGGNYTESLPHIVFSRRTLPWERTVDGKPPVFQRAANEAPTDAPRNPIHSQPVPWMALLLFEEAETPVVVNRKLAELISPGPGILGPAIAGDTSATGLRLMPWEDVEERCNCIDITATQFLAYIPALSAAALLAHAKKVRILHKDKNGIVDLDEEAGDTALFSTVVGSRLPARNQLNTAVLVSLEGFQDYIAAGKPGAALKTIPAGQPTVRMAALASWSFHNSGDASFTTLIHQLAVKRLQINDTRVDATLSGYLGAGYTAMPHLTRAGAHTAAWYHGPLVPQQTYQPSTAISFSVADAALRYDATTGMMDISFAAAWQLGRMLGLERQAFAKAVLAWRIAVKQAQIRKDKTDIVNTLTDKYPGNTVKAKVISYLKGAYTTTNNPPPENKGADTAVPKEVQDFLGQLFCLKGIPFKYLVPDEMYLEKESLAFFYVDANWITALMDGALSIGRSNRSQLIIDQAMAGNFLPAEYNVQQKVRIRDKELLMLPVTGFLLRSDLISGWRGIEIAAYDSNGALLPAFRFERIDKDIFLGVFNGNIAKIVITQPYEGLHFGIKLNNGQWEKDLKTTDSSGAIVISTAENINEALTGLINTKRIIDINGLAGAMKQHLSADIFTSAEFAFQMVDSPVKHTVTIKQA
ncbi:hypothetical protein [Chitinophaga nivalis]|uniref:Uncharacterized protein n=1 Tax=Chitinophaga nivalis TaxID=2991709 RepID=A0ABT3IJL2_9BACT|nr:hypothetical protein [Chitinophaga nivalis]MCW3466158.1 hypothetical protein [Chitinophaga nivalis]MCW3484151.1 hypothetical protein [Chitinophaga nivalis]